MNFVVNGRFLTQNLTGVQRFAVQIVEELGNSIDPVTILVPRSSLNLSFARNNVKIVVVGYLNNQLWEQIELPIWLKINGGPVLINLCNTAPLVYENNALVIHDLAFLENPKWFSFKFRTYYKFLVPKLINRSKIVFTVSKTIKNQILGYFPNRADINVIYNAANTSFRIIEGLPKKKIVLTVGSVDPRKNLKVLMQAFQLATLKNYKLVIVGEHNDNFNASDISDLPSNIIFTGRVNDDELIQYYNNSEVFVYISLYEGFGIPPLEAQQCGLPVILSNIDVFKEIYGASAILCNPLDKYDVSEKILALIASQPLQLTYSKKSLENSKNYSWKASADKIISVLNNYN